MKKDQSRYECDTSEEEEAEEEHICPYQNQKPAKPEKFFSERSLFTSAQGYTRLDTRNNNIALNKAYAQTALK